MELPGSDQASTTFRGNLGRLRRRLVEISHLPALIVSRDKNCPVRGTSSGAIPGWAAPNYNFLILRHLSSQNRFSGSLQKGSATGAAPPLAARPR